MYYTGMNPSTRKIGLARSSDGITWQKAAENPIMSPTPSSWDSFMIGWCDVVKVDTGYFMWYNGSTVSDGWNGIGLATSTDGVQWTKHSGNPILTPQPAAWDNIEVASPTVTRVDSQFYMIYLAKQPAGPLISPYEPGLATSYDGVQWTRYFGNPVMQTSANWDYSIGSASLMHRNNKFHLWYSGFQLPESDWQMGYAVSDSAATTGVASPEEIPGEFKLLPVYPNPFNPITNVEFALPTRSAVRLAVYDVLGRLVTTLVDEVRPAGTHTAKFDGKGLSSGTYYCRMEVGAFVSTAKIMLIK